MDVQGGWQNRALARLVNELARYNPAWDVPYIRAPTLMVVASDDRLCRLEVRLCVQSYLTLIMRLAHSEHQPII